MTNQQFIDACINDNIDYVLKHYNCVDYDTFLDGFIDACENENFHLLVHMIQTKKLSWKDALFNSVEASTKIQNLAMDIYNESIQEIFELGCEACLPHIIQKCITYVNISYNEGIEIVENGNNDRKTETLKFLKWAKNKKDEYLENRTEAELTKENEPRVIMIDDIIN